MVAIDIKEFFGERPRINDRVLPDKFCSRATDVDMEDFNLRPLREAVAQVVAFNTKPVTLVPHYTAPLISNPTITTGNFDGWFWLEHKTEVLFSPVVNDAYNRIIFQDSSDELRITDGDNITLSQVTPSVTTDWPLGVPAPAAAPGLVVAGPGTTPESRAYCYTFVDYWGQEGPPSPIPAVVTVGVTDTVTVSGFSTPPATHNFTNGLIRIYRTVSGSNATDFQFVAEIAVGTPSYVDSLLYEQLGEILPSREWFSPPTNLEGIKLLSSGIVVGFRNNTLFFSEAYRPHAWPPDYLITLKHKIIAVVEFGQSLVALTNGPPYLIGGTLPEAPDPRAFEVNEPCIDADSVVILSNAVFYASPNGLVAVTQGSVQIVSELAITRKQWEKVIANPLQATVYNDHYLAFYDTGESGTKLTDPNLPTKGLFLFRPEEGDFLFYSDTSDLITLRPDNELVYFLTGTGPWGLSEWNTGTAERSYSWLSKEFSLPRPISFTCLQVTADKYPVSIEFYADGELLFRDSVDSIEPIRLPADNKYTDCQIAITGKRTVYQLAVAQSLDELKQL